MTTVRIATQRDEPQLMNLCHELHQDNGIFKMDDELVRAMLYRCFEKKGAIIGVIDGVNELAAAVYMTFSHLWYTHDIHLEELFNFVRPQYRKSDYSRRLLAFMKECQEQLGVPLFTGIVTNQRTEAKVTMYRKRLGPPAGAFFVVGAHWMNEETTPSDDLWVRHSHGRDGKKQFISALFPATMTTMPMPAMTGNGL